MFAPRGLMCPDQRVVALTGGGTQTRGAAIFVPTSTPPCSSCQYSIAMAQTVLCTEYMQGYGGVSHRRDSRARTKCSVAITCMTYGNCRAAVGEVGTSVRAHNDAEFVAASTAV